MTYSEIEKKAFDIIKEYHGVPFGAKKYDVDVNRLAQAYGIDIHKRKLGGEISGLLVIKDGRASIGLESDQSSERMRFTIAHELGHYFLHRSLKSTFVDEVFARSGTSNRLEREANAFAAALLMPEELINDAIKEVVGSRPIRDEEIAELAKRFKVSSVSMTYRLVNLKIIEPPYI
jgi:Zn-dependent peptidase ImmA (M78 family)